MISLGVEQTRRSEFFVAFNEDFDVSTLGSSIYEECLNPFNYSDKLQFEEGLLIEFTLPGELL